MKEEKTSSLKKKNHNLESDFSDSMPSVYQPCDLGYLLKLSKPQYRCDSSINIIVHAQSALRILVIILIRQNCRFIDG